MVMVVMIWIWYFLFYSALGFGLEVLYTWMTRGSKKDRKCLLFLPLCPVYGLGAVGILLLPEGVTQRPGLLLLAAGCIATGAEYLLGWFYQRFWRVSFWDYSALPFHLHGRVCLPFALAWGLLSLPLGYWVQPLAQRWGSLLPPGSVAVLGLLFLGDWLMTGQVLRRSRSTQSLRWWVTSPLAAAGPPGPAPGTPLGSGQSRRPDAPSSPE